MYRGFRTFSLLSIAALVLVFGIGSAHAQTYSGQATALKSGVIVGGLPGVTTAVNDTGPLPSAGGSITLQSASATVPNILTAGASTVTTTGSGNVSSSTASVAGLDMDVAGFPNSLNVTADVVSSSTQCTCPTGTCTGSFVVTNLQIGGTNVTVDATAANQVVQRVVGNSTLTIIINEQILSPSSVTVNAMHITLTDTTTNTTTEVIVASAHSDIKCTFSPPINRYSGRATGVRLGVETLNLPLSPSNVTTIVADTGPLPTSGGNITVSTLSTNVPGVLTTGVVTSNTSAGDVFPGIPGSSDETAQSDSSVTNLSATLETGVTDVTITATLVESNTQCSCDILNASGCTGDSVVTDLFVSAPGLALVEIIVTGDPNQVFFLPAGLGSITINEQISADSGDLTVNALHVRLTPLGLASTDLIIAHSHSDIQCTLFPTAATASVSGRVLDPKGRPVTRATVRLSDSDGNVRSSITNQFGFYRFEDLPVARTYILAASHRSYSFTARTVSLSDELTGFDFTADSGRMRR